MFYDATAFNQDIGDWDVSSVTYMDFMFYDATAFNQDLRVWCVSQISIEPFVFDTGASSWTLQRPLWGQTCDSAPPVIATGQSFAYAAGQSSGATVATVSATDDIGVTGFSINSVTGADAQSYTAQGWFAVSSAGVLSLTSAGAGDVASNSASIAPNGFTLSITATDARGKTDTESVTLTVDGVAPVIVAGQSLSYAENQTADQPAATLQVSDDNAVTSLSIDAVVGSDGQVYTSEGYFTASASGAISLTEAGVASGFVNDFETEPNTFTLSFTASDAAGNTDTDSATLTVTNVDEVLPVMGADVEQTYAEGQPLSASLAQVTATDNEGITSYELVSVVGADEVDYTDDGWYEVSSTGAISLTEAGQDTAVNNYDIAPNSFTLAVVARDGAGNQTEDTATVTLNVTERIESTVDLNPTTGTYASSTPTLSWTRDALATQYHVEVYTVDSDGSLRKQVQGASSGADTTLVRTDTVTTNSITLPRLDYTRAYIWRVQPSNGYSNGQWSAFGSFTTEYPPVGRVNLITPAQNSTEVDVPTVFTWDTVANAVNYEFQLFTDAMLTEVVSLHTTDTTLTLDTLKANTDYLYRVRAKNQTSKSNWTNHEFTTAASGVATSTEGDDALPTAYDLSQNYPNPFNPTTTITYSLPQSGMVTLIVYDITGRFVTTLVNSAKGAGVHTIEFDANALSSGMYVYTLETDGYRQTRQMMLVK